MQGKGKPGRYGACIAWLMFAVLYGGLTGAALMAGLAAFSPGKMIRPLLGGVVCALLWYWIYKGAYWLFEAVDFGRILPMWKALDGRMILAFATVITLLQGGVSAYLTVNAFRTPFEQGILAALMSAGFSAGGFLFLVRRRQ